MLFNYVLLIISLLLANASAHCPTYWWPMSAVSSNISFFSEVMKGDNIMYLTGTTSIVAATTAYGRPDRTTPATGYRSISLVDATNAMQATPDFYFCNGAFTISLWGRPASFAAVGTILDFKDASAVNGVRLDVSATGFLRLYVNALAVSSSTGTFTAAVWNYGAVTFSGANTSPVFYNQVTSVSTITGIVGSATISAVPPCTSIVRAMIGQLSLDGTQDLRTAAGAAPGWSLNDLKIFNFALSAAQIQARFTAELSKFLNLFYE